MFAKTTKILVAALVLAGASITFAANAAVTPSQGSWQAEQAWMDRASSGGHHQGDTNGY